MTPERLAEIRAWITSGRRIPAGLDGYRVLSDYLYGLIDDLLAHIDALEKEAAVGREASRAILRVAMELPPYKFEEEQPGA